MGRARILVIEDENKTAAFLSKGLREAGFAVDVACDGEKGLEQARAISFDLLIVDVMLPHKAGWDLICRFLLEKKCNLLFFLPASHCDCKRVKCILMRADNYLL